MVKSNIMRAYSRHGWPCYCHFFRPSPLPQKLPCIADIAHTNTISHVAMCFSGVYSGYAFAIQPWRMCASVVYTFFSSGLFRCDFTTALAPLAGLCTHRHTRARKLWCGMWKWQICASLSLVTTHRNKRNERNKRNRPFRLTHIAQHPRTSTHRHKHTGQRTHSGYV